MAGPTRIIPRDEIAAMGAAHRPMQPIDVADRVTTRFVRQTIYANARKLIDWPAKYAEGRKMLRQQLAHGRQILRSADRYEIEDMLWAEWMVARITKALAANKRKAPALPSKVDRGTLDRMREMAERIEHLTGLTAWDEHKQETKSQRQHDAREAWVLAGRIVQLSGGRR